MKAKRPDVDEIFNAAAELQDPKRRAAFLTDACGGDSRLRAEIEDLLERDEEAGSFLAAPAVGPAPTIDTPIEESAGTSIGKYKLLQEIGEGGMGTVFMAEQTEPVKRRVALKIIKPGMDSRQVIARFEAERQALAMMDHPNIAKVLDAGTTDKGRPYFVMELVNGIPVTQFCDQQHLTARERLQLFIPICRAVQHAHQKGIIHRDIKPSNILVAFYDSCPVPKVIDFGVAKAVSRRLTEKTMFTGLGQIVGTIEYMSPEQAQRNQLDIDTRSDVYSLGVVLYELLTGDTPFDKQRLRSAAIDELLRIIREEEPPRPSTKLSSSETLPSVAENRRIEPAKLSSLIRGELDWIVMKALEKDRARRYETASEFAEDVQHYLSDERVVACPPSAAYRFRKFAQRNRVALATATVVAAALILGASMAIWQAVRATGQFKRAVAAEWIAEKRLQDEEKQRQRAEVAETQARKNAETANEETRRIRGLRYVADMHVAGMQWSEGSMDRVISILRDHCPDGRSEDLRGFEWFYLWWQCNRAMSRPTVQLDERCLSVEYSPDDKYVALGHSHGNVSLLKLAEPRETTRLTANRAEWFPFTAFSPDGGRFVYANKDAVRMTVRWLRSGMESEFPRSGEIGHTEPITSATFSPSGEVLATAGRDGRVVLWNGHSYERRQILSDHQTGVYSLCFSHDGSFLAAGGDNSQITVWREAAGGFVVDRQFSLAGKDALMRSYPQANMIWSLDFSSDGNFLAAANVGHAVKVLGLHDETEYTLRGHDDQVRWVRFSPDNSFLATGSRDDSVKLWNVSDFSLIHTFRGSKRIAFSARGDAAVLTGLDGRVAFWDTQSPIPIDRLHCGRRPSAVATSGDAGVIAVLSSSSQQDAVQEITFWNQMTGSMISKFDSPNRISCLAGASSGLIAAGGAAGEILLWDGTTGDPLEPLTIGKPILVKGLAFSHDSTRLFATCKDGTIFRWERGAQSIGSEKSDLVGSASRIAADEAGTVFATGSGNGRVALWDGETLRLLWDWKPYDTILGKPVLRDIAISPDGRYLATAGFGENALLWDLSNKSPKPEELTDDCLSLAFSPDSNVLATGDTYGEVTLWDVQSRQRRFTLEGHESAVERLVYSHDGDTIFSASRDRTIRMWRAATRDEVANAGAWWNAP